MENLETPQVSGNRHEQSPTSRNVIVIEDDSVLSMLLAETLADIGFSSASFDTASAAMTHLQNINGCCALIIADQGLPGGTRGSEFIQMAKQIWPIIPAILTSGYPMDEQVIPPLTAYIQKPYTLAQLEQTIATALLQQRFLL